MFSTLTPMFRSLTVGPAAAAINQAHRMARRRIADGGAAEPIPGDANKEAEATAFVLPADVDALVVAKAVRQKLEIAEPVGEGADALHPLERRKLGGKIVLPDRHLLRLGDGRFDLGRRYLRAIVAAIHAKRARPIRT